VASALLALPAIIVLVIRRASRAADLGLGPVRERTVPLSSLLGLTLWVGSIGLMEMQSLLIPPPPEYLQAFRHLHVALRGQGPVDGLAALAAIALVPAVSEELVMRGVLLPALVPRLGAAKAVVASAFAFAAMHGDLYRFLFTLGVGLVLGAVRLRSGSLVPPILAHATLNAVTFFVAPLLDDPAQMVYEPQPLLGLLCLVAGTALTLPVARSLRAVDSPGDPA
jgi:hypothetical protein